jgi:glycosyltransferase involved in cell wall biosynthesis
MFRAKEWLRPYYLRWLYFKLFPQARPAEFSACWQFPCFPLQPDELSTRVRCERPPALIFYPMADLHARIQRTQQLALALAENGNTCFLLNPHLGRQFSKVRCQDPDAKFGLLGPRMVELHVRLPSEPVYHSRLLDPSESERLAGAIAPLSAFSGACFHQIVSLPTWLDAAILLRKRFGWPIIYDCHDLISGFRAMSRDIVAAESRAFEEADLVLFSSMGLVEDLAANKASLKAKSMILRNAADPARFAGVAEARRRRGAAGAIGYFGALDEWFDIEAVEECVKRSPDRKFQLIGRVEYQPIRALARFPNVELIGEVPYEKLPDWVAGFDVALIPFRITPLTRATNPIKLYEYFSCGLPVVSSRLPEVELFEPLVYLADSAKDFPDAVRQALEESGPEKPALRMEAAQRETWNHRAAAALEAVQSLHAIRL